jgi:Protein of unknown function (DUF1203)
MSSPGYGHPASVKVATGHGPCRHCLEPFVVGEERRILFTLNSFEGMEAIPQPGPVFVHEQECVRFAEDAGYPAKLREFGAVLDAYDERQMIVRRELILDGTQETVLRRMFEDDAVRYVLVRDATAGCYDFRVERGAR